MSQYLEKDSDLVEVVGLGSLVEVGQEVEWQRVLE